MGSAVSFRRTTLISFGLASFLTGLGLARTRLQVTLPSVLVISLVFIILLIIKNKLIVFGVILFGLLFGLWRGANYLKLINNYSSLYKHPVTIVGLADSDGIYSDKSQLAFDLGHLQVTKPYQKALVGKLGIKGFGEYMIYKGDTVEVSGKLYPTRGSHQASISFANIKTLKRSNSLIQSIRRRFETGLESTLGEPSASFGLGLLIGERSTLPKDITQQLTAVGLTHVVAVSGYNLTIIMRAVRRLLKKRSKYQSTVISIILIGLFLLVTGFSASIVRAALVSILSLWAWYYGRTFRPILLILLAAALTAGFYPLYIWSDIGWYLSFLAFFGIMVVAPLLTKRIFKNKQPKVLAALIIETSTAQIMTMPIIMYIFGQFSMIALLANVLVVPLVPVGMLLSLVAGLGGMFLASIAGWLAWPARLVMTYMLDIVSALAKLPKALVQQPIELWQMIGLYSIVLLVVVILWLKNRGKRDIIET